MNRGRTWDTKAATNRNQNRMVWWRFTPNFRIGFFRMKEIRAGRGMLVLGYIFLVSFPIAPHCSKKLGTAQLGGPAWTPSAPLGTLPALRRALNGLWQGPKDSFFAGFSLPRSRLTYFPGGPSNPYQLHVGPRVYLPLTMISCTKWTGDVPETWRLQPIAIKTELFDDALHQISG